MRGGLREAVTFGALVAVTMMLVTDFTSVGQAPRQGPDSSPVRLMVQSTPYVAGQGGFAIERMTSGTSTGFLSNPGDAIVVYASIYGRDTVAAVTDSAKDSFRQIVNSTMAYGTSGAYSGLSIWIAANVAGGSSVTLTVTLHPRYSNSQNNSAIVFADVTGVAPQPLDAVGVVVNSSSLTNHQSAGYSSSVKANTTDLVVSGVGARNYDNFVASGNASRVYQQVGVLSSASQNAMTCAVLEASQGRQGGVLWVNSTSNKSSAWVADSIALAASGSAAPSTYGVTFSESGLATGTSWSVTVNGSSVSANAPNSIAFSEPNGLYSYSVGGVSGHTISPSSGSLSVLGAAVNVSIAFAPTITGPSKYNVTFSESGLASGTAWSVILNGTSVASTAPGSVALAEPNGTYSYNVGTVTGYTSSPSSGSVVASGAPVIQAITFSPDARQTASYSVTFSEAGVPASSRWSVTLNNSTNSALEPGSIQFAEQNGTYGFTVGTVPGCVATPISGSIIVSGSVVSLAIRFNLSAVSPAKYSVAFNESGLAPGTSWSVTFNGTSSSASSPNAIVFSEPNGLYSYSVGAVNGHTISPSSGSLSVLGAAVNLSITFGAAAASPSKYNVTFSESGLASGIAWSVVLNGTSGASTAPSSVALVEPNGTYSYSVGTVTGYTASPTSGSVTVNGANVSQPLRFNSTLSTTKYAVTFSETGLPLGTTWSASLNSSARSTSAPGSIGFNLSNGTYPFVAGPVNGYTALPSAGLVSVGGSAARQTIKYAAEIQHVVVIVLENQAYSSVVSKAPYEAYLAKTYGAATSFYAACHGSLPDYAAMTSGRTFVCGSGSIPIEGVSNLADLFESHSYSWMGYFEGMANACQLSGRGSYVSYHNPFILYKDIRYNATRCDAHIVNSAQFNSSVAAGTLPAFSYYVPSSYDDCYVTNLSYCDHWLRSFLSPMLNSTNTTVERLMSSTAFFVVNDEAAGAPAIVNGGYSAGGVVNSWCKNTTGKSLSVCGGQVVMTVVSPYSIGTFYRANASDYSMESTIEWLFGLGSDGGYDGTAGFPAMSSLFSFAKNGVVASAALVPSHLAPAAPSLGASALSLTLLGGTASGTIGLTVWTRLRRGRPARKALSVPPAAP